MGKNKNAFNEFIISGNTVRWSILILVTVIFTIILYPNLAAKRHSYKLGDVVERDIKAPKDFLVQDDTATEESRKRAVENVLTVYDHNTALLPQLTENIRTAFDIVQQVINTANRVQSQNRPGSSGPDGGATAEHPVPRASLRDMIWQKKSEFEEKIGDSILYGGIAYCQMEQEEFQQSLLPRIHSYSADGRRFQYKLIHSPDDSPL